MQSPDEHPPQQQEDDEDSQRVEQSDELRLHALRTSRSARETWVTNDSNSTVSRVALFRGKGRLIGISWAMRPGEAARTTILVERNTASATEWVTKTAVQFCSDRKRR